MSNEIQTIIESIQNDIITDPEVLKNAVVPTKELRTKIANGFLPYAFVRGEWSGNLLKPNVDLIVGFLALQDIEFTIRYNDVECKFKMTPGQFHFAFDKRSVVPLCATVFTQVRIVGNPLFVLPICALIPSKVRYALLINPSTWTGTGRTAIVRDGQLSV